eukprot:TRINITY_DN1099_c0_g4_i1.p1 TRINITY_DN1099_c0_g4~~TRINITY_DN1099_c0_g4_i1.p1  ORF type:complete len:469 (-),score=59.89 TRINITY_DN1099_c0_g4_i1:152-1348(-)
MRDETDALIEEQWTVENPQYATDFVFVPLKVERLIVYGMFVCADAFLFIFTLLPIRFVVAIGSSIKILLGIRKRLYYIQKIDLLRGVLILLSLSVVIHYDTSRWGEFVQNSSIKLKMVWVAMEFLDKLLVSYGNNILGSLFWAVNVDSTIVIRGRWWHFLVAWGYTVVHASVLLLHLSVINIAVHEANKTLLALLVLVQFAEVKAAAMKSTGKAKLFDTCCDDIVERFQLLVYLCYICMHNMRFKSKYYLVPTDSFMEDVFYAAMVIYMSEVAIDWIKHASICSFNHLNPAFYDKTCAKFAMDLGSSPHTTFLTDRSFLVSKKLGLFPLPLSVVLFKLIYDWLPNEFTKRHIGVLVTIFLGFWALKTINNWILEFYIESYRTSKPLDLKKIKEVNKSK